MKKISAFVLCPLLLCSCSESEYIHSSEPRSQVYYGQPIADVYENLGVPAKAIRLSANERVLIWISQEIEKEWAYRYLRACTVKIHLKDERVVNWAAEGQGCVISSADKNELEKVIASKKDSNKPKMLSVSADAFGSGISTAYSPSAVSALSNASSITIGGHTLPDDAFDDGFAHPYSPAFSAPSKASEISASSAVSTRTNRGYVLPDDAFEGQSVSSPAPSFNQSSPSSPANTSSRSESIKSFSWFSAGDEDDEWGLFDS